MEYVPSHPGKQPPKTTRYNRNTEKQQRACDLYRQGKTLDEIVKTVKIDFYRLRIALDRAGLREYRDDEKPPDRCPCGVLTGVPGQKFCSHEHRMEYGRLRQADPENYVIFNCLNCGKKVKRYKKYGKGHNKYCSNDCAIKHTKKKQHIVVDDAIVLDSGFEVFFWGLCALWKIPIERADRSQAIEVNGKGGYCPDFYLPAIDLWVETKGYEDADDRTRYNAWIKAGHRLAVLIRSNLHELRLAETSTVVVMILESIAKTQAIGIES